MPGMAATMKEFGKGQLHSGSKQGPKVTSRKQAIAIGMHESGKDRLGKAMKGMRG